MKINILIVEDEKEISDKLHNSWKYSRTDKSTAVRVLRVHTE